MQKYETKDLMNNKSASNGFCAKRKENYRDQKETEELKKKRTHPVGGNRCLASRARGDIPLSPLMLIQAQQGKASSGTY